MEIRLYTPEDKEKVLALDICEVELMELKASMGNPVEALEKSLEVSHTTWIAIEDDKVLAVAGIALHPTEEGIGIPWMLSNDTFMRKHLFKTTTMVYQYLDYCFNDLDLYCLANQVSIDNRLSRKWLASLGFEFMGKSYNILDDDVWFEQFYMYKEDYCV